MTTRDEPRENEFYIPSVMGFRWNKKRILFTLLMLLVVFIITLTTYSFGHVKIADILSVTSDEGFTDWLQRNKPTRCVSESSKNEKDTFGVFPIELPIPRIVHQILWNDTFTFRNYLSLLSVVKVLKPYVILLYTRKSLKPKLIDYNLWYEKAISEISSLQVIQLDLLDKMKYYFAGEHACALSCLRKSGGIYVNLNTIINSDLWQQQNNRTFYAGLADETSVGFIAMTKPPDTTERLWANVKPESVCKCVSPELFTGSETCCTVPKAIFPVNIMLEKSSFGSFARTLFYDSPDFPAPKTSFPPIPKIVHYVWFGSNDINYSNFLSFLSIQRFVKPLKIFIYVDTKISRMYFDKMAAYSNVQIVLYGPLKSVFQASIRDASHASDIVRADVLLRFGGIYLDWDVYWLKPLDDLLSLGYETIATLDFYKDMYPRNRFPDTINLGVLLARPQSRFLKLWQDSFKEYKYTGNIHYTWHAVELVYKLYEEHPDLLAIEKRLQVMCHYSRCHPLWMGNYNNDSIHYEFDFTKDAYSVHFTQPTPKEFTSETLLKESKGFISDIGKHILG